MLTLSVQSPASASTNASSLTPMPGLQLKMPQGDGESALVLLNLPNPYAKGTDFPGGSFGISVNGTVSPVTASFTYNEQVPPSTGRVPTTLAVSVPLSVQPQSIVALWAGVRGSTVIIDTPATLSIIY